MKNYLNLIKQSKKLSFDIISIVHSLWTVIILVVFMASGCAKATIESPNNIPISTSKNNNPFSGTQVSVLQPISLGKSIDFTILTKTGITTTGVTAITGNIGSSPITSTGITGFGLIMSTDNQYSSSTLVNGNVYGPDYAAPTPTKMTTAIGDMENAFTTANDIVAPAPITEIYAGNISGQIIKPGLYKWGTNVLISNAGVTLTGGANDVIIFQIAQNLIVNNNAIITLLGGIQAKNIFWVVSGQATVGTYSNFKGNILSKTLISLNTGAVVTGRLFAQTAVTMIANSVIPQ